MEEFKSNSYKSKMEAKNEQVPTRERKFEKVVTKPVKKKKKSGMAKLAETFIQEDISTVKQKIIEDVVIPAVKKILDDAISESIHMLLYKGEPRERGRGPRVSYDRYYSSYRDRDRDRDRDDRRDERPRPRYSPEDIVLDSRGEAEEILAIMREALETYRNVSVADFYDLVGVTGDYTDNKYGWVDLQSARVVRVSDGYIIKFPRIAPID